MMLSPDGSAIKLTWTLPSEITQLYQAPDKTIWIATRTEGLFSISAHLLLPSASPPRS